MSFKPEVVADSSGKFCGNALAFETEKEAEDYARDLARRWTLVTQWRVVPSEQPVNYRYVDGKTIAVLDVFDKWPRDEKGRLICNAKHPMPDRPSTGLHWVHEVSLDTLKCSACGLQFTDGGDHPAIPF
jgi:hypothetical protein